MDTAQWPQEMVVKPIEDIAVTTAASLERKPRPQKEQALNCPRCHSTNTKFCYYNNYSLTQPRYFCKTCRRYWTEGGSLRNIPVGGGSRKNKRSNSNSASACSSVPPNKKLPSDLITPPQNPKIDEGQDLNLAFRNIPELGIKQNNNNNSVSASASASSTITTNTTSTTTAAASSTSQHHHLSALELLTGITNSGSRGNYFMHVPLPVPADPNSTVYTCGYPLQDFKPTLNFSLDHVIGGSLHGNNVQETSGRLLFPFEDLKQVSSNNTTMVDNHNHNNNKEQHHGDSAGGFWTGMLGGGGGGTW